MTVAAGPVPPRAELLAWWRCGRKLAHGSEVVAVLAAEPYGDVTPYPCGDHWHIGRTPARRSASVKRARRAWLAATSSVPEMA